MSRNFTEGDQAAIMGKTIHKGAVVGTRGPVVKVAIDESLTSNGTVVEADGTKRVHSRPRGRGLLNITEIQKDSEEETA